jgi:hypothetical protein
MRQLIFVILLIALAGSLFWIATGKPPAVAAWGAIHNTYIPAEQPGQRR